MFSVCITLARFYPQDISHKDEAQIILMKARCHCIIAATSVSIARTEDKVEEQLQRYIETRHHIASFDSILQTIVHSLDEEVKLDLLSKMATLFVFDFEGAICLQAWDDLGQIVRKAKECRDEMSYKAMADCLLRSQAPGKGRCPIALS